MNSFIDYIFSFKESELTFITPEQNVRPLKGSILENKQKNYTRNQIMFLENVRVLEKVSKKTDARSVTLTRKIFNICRECLTTVAKIERSATIEKEVLINLAEFTYYIEDNISMIDELIADNLCNYSTKSNAVSLSHLKIILKNCVNVRGREETINTISSFISTLE